MMKRLAIILAGAITGAAAVIWWRRRAQAASPAPVQLGLSDGSTLTLSAGEPGADGIPAAAGAVRLAFVAGA
jgi:hypothetical protein